MTPNAPMKLHARFWDGRGRVDGVGESSRMPRERAPRVHQFEQLAFEVENRPIVCQPRTQANERMEESLRAFFLKNSQQVVAVLEKIEREGL
jgi:hypothetical protein